MSKERNVPGRQEKKKPLLTPKERKALKRSKKEARNWVTAFGSLDAERLLQLTELALERLHARRQIRNAVVRARHGHGSCRNSSLVADSSGPPNRCA